jgi:hypothetical protein
MRAGWALLLLGCIGCASSPRRANSSNASDNGLLAGDREVPVKVARSLIGKKKIEWGGKRFPYDCTGVVLAAYAPLGISLKGEAQEGDNGVTAVYRFAQRYGRTYEGGRPVPGDLVFFKNTYDLNRDGMTNDGLTHIALVEEVQSDGTIVLIHRVSRGITRYRMNLFHPDKHKNPQTGETWNDYLRGSGFMRKARLTSELFASYATLLPNP